MGLLKAIGGFFARIGRWIRDTAWVQPLLIVGGIFGIIFSIKPISNAISGWFKSGDESLSFYRSFQISLQGAENNNSDCDRLIKNIEDGKLDGQKFFLSFVKEDCSNCTTCYPGYSTLRENWNRTTSFDMGNSTFKMYTIFIDERNSDDELLIDDLLINHQDFFLNLVSRTQNMCDDESYYYYRNISETNKKTFYDNLETIANTIGAREEEEAEGFVSPTTFLFDSSNPSPEGWYEIDYAITACFFNYTSDLENTSDFEKAYLLRDCWNYKGIFSKDYEPK